MEPRLSPPPGEHPGADADVHRLGLGGMIRAVINRRKTLVAVAVLAVFGFSSIPFEHQLGLHRFDKVFHLVEYLAVGLVLFNLITRGFRQVSWIGLALGYLCLATIGAIDEFYQYWIPGRTPDRTDFFYSAMGAALALAITAITGFLISRNGRKQDLPKS